MPASLPSLTRLLKPVALALVVAAAAVLPVRAEMSAAQKTEIEKVIKDYLIKNPEVLRDALVELDRRSKAEEEATRAKAVSDLSPKIFNSKHQIVLGNPEGKVQLVEFFDYNCGYCRRAMADLDRLMKKNPDLRVVLKEFPVLGPPSKEAAIVASALHMQFDGKKYWDFHRRLMATRGRIGKAQALAAARAAGADMERLTKDMQSKEILDGLGEVTAIADALNMTGTPSYVVGPDVVVGAVGFDKLQERIDNIRKCGKAKCG
ncbi:MAG: DsbA family protein [Beijerinckiaceae bacterium]